MYALVHNKQVISGPRSWDSAFFTFILNDKNIAVEKPIPRNATEDEFHSINSDTYIIKVEIQQDQINPLVEFLEGPFFEVLEEKVVATYNKVDTPLQFAKNNFKQDVATKRYEKEIKGTKFVLNGSEYSLDTTREGRNIVIQKYMLMSDTDNVNFKFPEGWLQLSKAELSNIVSYAEAYIQSCFDWEKSYNDRIEGACSKEELLQIHSDLKNELNGIL